MKSGVSRRSSTRVSRVRARRHTGLLELYRASASNERDIVMANRSVRPVPVLCLNEWTYRHIF